MGGEECLKEMGVKSVRCVGDQGAVLLRVQGARSLFA